MKKDKIYYRPINLELLGKNRRLPFDIYCFTASMGETRFVKFASAFNPRHQEKVLELLEAEDFHEQFYVQEDDLIKYYEQATESLRKFMTSDQIPLETKTRKMYRVSMEIMKEFFEHNATKKILRRNVSMILRHGL
ncbi:MAG: hypothetical protein ACE5GQ_11985 [Nitrospinales bacterium]